MGKVRNKRIPTYPRKTGSLLQFSFEHMLKVVLFRELHEEDKLSTALKYRVNINQDMHNNTLSNENAQIVGNDKKPEEQRVHFTYKISNPLTMESCQPH